MALEDTCLLEAVEATEAVEFAHVGAAEAVAHLRSVLRPGELRWGVVSEAQCFDGEDNPDVYNLDDMYFWEEGEDSDGEDWAWDCIARCKNRGRAGSALHIRRMERRAEEEVHSRWENAWENGEWKGELRKKFTTPGKTERRPRQKYTAGAARRARRGELSEVFANRPTAFLAPLEEKRSAATVKNTRVRKAAFRAGRNTSGEADLAAQLGLDLATYQMLRGLERRDIRPEDYELLGRLDEAVKPATLNLEELQRFPTQTYFIPPGAMCDTITAKSDKIDSFGGSAFGMDFWKLSLPHFDEEPQNCSSDCSTTSGSLMNESCSVCLAELEEGDLLRVLPCSHHFHKECIDHWLLHSSTACPACKCDLSRKS